MADKKLNVLIVEDESSIREGLSFSLAPNYGIYHADCGQKALELFSRHSIDVVLLDIKLPDMNGLEVLSNLKEMDKNIPVIIITAVKTVDSAVRSMKLGAYDYLTKPFDIEELKKIIEKALHHRMLEHENAYLKKELAHTKGFEKMIAKSEKMEEIFRLIGGIAKSDSTILISGESGTGKELVARAIHNQSNRKNKLFVAVNCAAIPENLFESELFGHERGAFTGALERHIGKFEIATGGTLFLDEIALMPLSMQAKLLRVLQDQTIDRVGGSSQIKIDVRVIAATNANLRNEVEEKRFRSDLYYRLNVIPMHIPPLKERTVDIPILAEYFLEKYSKEFKKKVDTISKDALEAIVAYEWPGNVRELENLMERMIVLCHGNTINTDLLPPEIAKSKSKFIDIVDEHTKKFELDFIKSIAEKARINERQLKALSFIKENGSITKQNYIKLTNSTKTTAFRDISELVKMNIISQKGVGKSSYYTIS